MRLVDANVLLYSVNSDAEHQAAARAWLDAGLSGRESIGLAWVPLLAFVRLATKPGLFPHPLSPAEAMARVDSWLGARRAALVNPTARHAGILSRLLGQVGSGGNLVNDAHLAALALEHRAEVVSYDPDFSRFDGLTGCVPTTWREAPREQTETRPPGRRTNATASSQKETR